LEPELGGLVIDAMPVSTVSVVLASTSRGSNVSPVGSRKRTLVVFGISSDVGNT
jgi:hypothetical protein